MNKYLSGKDTLSSARKEQKRSYWMLVLPAVVIYLSVMAFPTVFSIVLSMTSYNGGKIFGGRIPVEFV
ncbi:MAG: sugar ABC transporter permease, partial [Sphaerochaeta sp.]